MRADSVWSTWKPYAAVVALAAVGIWWWNSQSSAATLKSGIYACQAVFVNQAQKYELYVDDTGRELGGYARVLDGEVTSYSAPDALNWNTETKITVRRSGSSHFHATQDPAVHSYDALACDFSEG